MKIYVFVEGLMMENMFCEYILYFLVNLFLVLFKIFNIYYVKWYYDGVIGSVFVFFVCGCLWCFRGGCIF